MKENPEIFEVWLDDKKIDGLIKKLNKLKLNKEHEHFDDKKGNLINFIHEETEMM